MSLSVLLSFKWTVSVISRNLASAQRWKCLIHNCTLETFILSVVWRTMSFDSHFWRETATENNQFSNLKTLISNSYNLIRQSFYGHSCELGISPSLLGRLLEIMLTVPLRYMCPESYAYSPFKIMFLESYLISFYKILKFSVANYSLIWKLNFFFIFFGLF